MSRLATLRHVRIAGFALGAVVVAGAAVLVTASAAGISFGFHPASSSQPGTTGGAAALDRASSASAVCTDFVSHLSADLKVDQTQLNGAVQKAIGETLADQVKNGALTSAQAAAIQKRLTAQAPCALAARLGKRPAAGAGAQVGAYKQQLLAAAAAALGIGESQLQTDLTNGMSLSQVAAAQKPPVTEAQFRSRLITQLKPLLDAAVSSQKLTSAQESAILQRLQSGPIPFWSTPMRKPRPVAPAGATTSNS